MSAGDSSQSLRVDRDLSRLAPKFREAVEAALAECAAAKLDTWVYEAHRSEALQRHYFRKGRTIIPPTRPVTNAPTALRSWHGYGLAVDVVDRNRLWKPDGGLSWFERVATIFKRHNCKWGGDWTSPDPPHFQWHLCRPSPSDEARNLLATGGVAAVWEALSAT